MPHRRANGRILVRLVPCGVLVAGVCGAVGGCGEAASPDERIPIEPTVVLGEVGMQPGQFGYPRAMDGDGRYVWVIDRLARVQRIDPRAEFRSKQWVSGWRMPAFERGKPTGISAWVGKAADGGEGDADARTLIFVADTHYYRVLVYTPGAAGSKENAPIAAFGGFGTGPGRFVYVTDIGFLPSADGTRIERLYCVEYGGNDRVSIFEVVPPDEAGGGESGERIEMMTEVSGIAVDSARVPSWFGGLRWIGSFGSFGSDGVKGEVYFNRPQSVAVDAARREVLVTDANHHRVGRFTLDGELIAWIGGRPGGSEDGDNGGGEGGVDVADTPGVRDGADAVGGVAASTRSMRSELTPEAAEKLAMQDAGTLADASREIAATGTTGMFELPYGLTVLGDGTALVTEFGASRVQRVDIERGTRLSVWGKAGRRAGELVNPWATCVIDDRVFVLDSGNNRVMGFIIPGVNDAGRRAMAGLPGVGERRVAAAAGGEP